MLTFVAILLACDHLAIAIVAIAWWRASQRPAPVTPAPPVPDRTVLQERALTLTKQASALDGSGEARRHQVYARLIKEFPTESKRVLSRAIEDAVEQL